MYDALTKLQRKDQIILATGRKIMADFWVPDDIESFNFQNLVVSEFPETSKFDVI